MKKIAHIINLFKPEKLSDLNIAQPITIETMRTARSFYPHLIEVSQLITQYSEERSAIPKDFDSTADLKRSILDIKSFNVTRKLPLMKDILDNLYYNTTAEYLIYTNVDIALQPYFYWTVSKIIEQGYDGFIINRRTIPGTYKKVDDIPLMYSELGEKHLGWDCFVFKRSLYPHFELGTACIGTGWIGRILITNIACFAKQFKIFTDLHLTFHIGDEESWKSDAYNDYFNHNRNECRKILTAFEQKFGKFDRDKIPGRFFTLLEKFDHVKKE